VVGDESGLVTLLDSTTLQPIRRPVQVGNPIAWMSASPNNRSALVLTGGQYIFDWYAVPSTGWALVDTEDGKVVRRGKLPVVDGQVVAYSPDGRHVAIGSGQGQVLVLDTATGSFVRPPIAVHQGWTNGLAYSPDGSLLVSSGYDGSVSLFDGRSAELLGAVNIPNHQLVTADFLADGHTVVIGSYDDGIYRWDTRLEHATETACRMAGRDLSEAEWRENFGDRPYQKTC
jgi:WD40 repeat protein